LTGVNNEEFETLNCSSKILTKNRDDDPSIITDVFVEKIDPACDAIHYATHAIWIMIDPVCIKKYAIPISFLKSKEEAIALLETVRAYLCYRYGI